MPTYLGRVLYLFWLLLDPKLVFVLCVVDYDNCFYYSALYNEYKTTLRQLFWKLCILYCLVAGVYILPYLLDYTPPSNKRPPPLRGLSYCAGFLSRTHAPPCSDPYMYIRVRLLDRACAIRDIHACVCNVAQSFYSSIMSNNMKKI